MADVPLAALRLAPGCPVPLGQSTGLLPLLRRAFPGVAALPAPMADPPAVVVVNGAPFPPTTGSAITDPIHCLARSGSFTLLGGPLVPRLTAGSLPALIPGGYAASSPSPYTIEFDLDSVAGTFEIVFEDSGAVGTCRVVIDGEAVADSDVGPTFSGTGTAPFAVLLGRVAGAPGRHRVRVECGPWFVFAGVIVGPTDAVRPVPAPGVKLVAAGDSHTEPTVSDAAPVHYWGYAQHLGTLLGVDAASCGLGGTGYLYDGGVGAGKVTFRARLADAIGQSPDVVLWAGGANDPLAAGFSYAAMKTEALACFAEVAAALPKCQQIVLSPFTSRGRSLYTVEQMVARDALRDAAAEAGLPFLDVLAPPADPRVSQPPGVTTAPASTGAGTISSSVAFDAGTIVQFGATGSTHVRRVASVSGSGPYALDVTEDGQTLIADVPAGSPIAQVREGEKTGVGTAGVPATYGNATRYTGLDSAHDTMLGHRNRALAIYHEMQFAGLA